MRISQLSHRNGQEKLAAQHEIRASILASIINAQEACSRKTRLEELTKLLLNALRQEGWNCADSPKKLRGGVHAKKGDVVLSIELEHPELFYGHYLRLLHVIRNSDAEVGVFITSDSKLSLVKADLAWLNGTITVPIWVIALK